MGKRGGLCETLAEIGERQPDADVVEGNHGIRARVILAYEAVLRAPPDCGGGMILLDKDVGVQRRDREIGRTFLLLINPPRALADDLEDDRRLVLENRASR